jgi:hypothetical protein
MARLGPDYKRMNGSANETKVPPSITALPVSGLAPLLMSNEPRPTFMARGTRISKNGVGPGKIWANPAPTNRPTKPRSKGPTTPITKIETFDSGKH